MYAAAPSPRCWLRILPRRWSQPDLRRTVSRHSLSPQEVIFKPWGVTSPERLAFLSRRSMGSIPKASASSSICCSTANVAWGLPKPLTEPP